MLNIILHKEADTVLVQYPKTDKALEKMQTGYFRVKHHFFSHDLAHYVVEKQLGLKGFWYYLHQGLSIEQLSDKAVIHTLHPNIWTSEIYTRNLQSMASGAFGADDGAQAIHEELLLMKLPSPGLDELKSVLEVCSSTYAALMAQWKALEVGESLHLPLPFICRS
jgi:hypothetical protein